MSVALTEVMVLGTSNDLELMDRLARDLSQGDVRATASPVAADRPIDSQLASVAAAVVLLWTRDAASSDWLLKHVDEARSRGPVIVGVTDSLDLPGTMSEMPTVDISRWINGGDPRALVPLTELVRDISGSGEPSEFVPGSASEPISQWENDFQTVNQSPPAAHSAATDEETSETAPEVSTPAAGRPAASQLAALRPGSLELVVLAEAVAQARGVQAGALDVVLAALLRPVVTSLDPEELAAGATYALYAAIPEPRSDRLERAHTALGADPSVALTPTSPPEAGAVEKIVSGSPELAALVDEASQFAAQVAGPVLTKMAPTAPQVFSHHLVGVALSRTSLPLPVSRALGVDDATLCDALLAAVRQRWPQESPAPWTALLSRPPGEAVATFHHDDTRRRDLLAEDSLDIAPHVRALALLVTSKVLKPPLAVGLFGDWGSGKTYFMRALRQEVDRLTTQARRSGLRQADLPVYRNVAQIEFNAWHFVDADLWASLADYIFANLRIREDEQEHAVSRRRQMYVAKLSEQGAAIRQVETERQHLQARIRLSETELEEVRAQARSQLGLKEYTRAVVTASPPLRDEVKQLTSRLGVPQAGESVADLEDALGQARATATSARSSVGVLAGRFGTGWSLLAVAALLFGPLVLWLTAYLDIDAFQRTAATAAGLIGGLAAWIRTASTAAGATLKQIDDLDHALADEVERHPTVVDHREALEALREEEKRLIAEESRLRKELISVEQALRELSPAKLLADFILSRNDSDDYRKHLGLASLIRRDFEALAGHIDEYNASLEDEDPDSDDSGLTDESDQPEAEGEQGNGAPSEAEYHVNRIVLYIDDLDRCPPETVAKVLQAVHLLLAFPLFVVIVGVDARWLSRSLTQHYEGLLQSEARESSDSSATPQDYLEKIFQIPFWLRPMPLDATTRLLDALTAIQPSESVAAEGDRARDRTAGSRAVGIGAESDQPSTVQAEQTSAPDPGVAQPSAPTAAADAGAAPRGSAAPTPAPAYDLRLSATEITQAERNFMEELRPMLGRSPRSLTRYVNILRLLKAVDRHSRATAPTHTDTSALDDVTMFLLAVLTGYPRIAEPLLAEIAQSRVEGMGSSVAALVEGARTRVDGMRSDSGAWSDNADEWDDLTNWIAQHSDWADSQDVGSWGPTAQRVARYSYRFDALAPARTT